MQTTPPDRDPRSGAGSRRSRTAGVPTARVARPLRLGAMGCLLAAVVAAPLLVGSVHRPAITVIVALALLAVGLLLAALVFRSWRR